MREYSKIHAGMELWGIIIYGTITLRGRSWEGSLHVLSIDGEHQKVGRCIFKPAKNNVAIEHHIALVFIESNGTPCIAKWPNANEQRDCKVRDDVSH
jgi:hypothetical protein